MGQFFMPLLDPITDILLTGVGVGRSSGWQKRSPVEHKTRRLSSGGLVTGKYMVNDTTGER